MTRRNDKLRGMSLTMIPWVRANAAKVLVNVLLVFGLPALAAASPGCGGSVGPGGGVVTLNFDILQCAAVPALIVTGPVTLDMRGHKLTCESSSGSFGILLLGSVAVLRNGSVSGCGTAVEVGGSGNHLVHDMVASANSNRGFSVGSAKNVLTDNAASANNGGFVIFGNNNRLVTNTAKGNDTAGFLSLGGQGNVFIQNSASGNKLFGFFSGGTGYTFQGNTAAANGSPGFEIAGIKHQLVQNTAIGNNAVGFSLSGFQFVISQNTAMGNLLHGFWLDALGASSVTGNKAFANGNTGIKVTVNSHNNTLSGNVALANSLPDLLDDNPGCDANSWKNNIFHDSNAACVQ